MAPSSPTPSRFRRLLAYIGPGILVAVGYMDPGNWATDLAAGSGFGFGLLWVVLAASLAGVLFQHLAIRLAIGSGKDLAQACRERHRPGVAAVMGIGAQLAIIATDLAELLGSAIALQLLFGIPIFWGAALTALDVLLLLGLRKLGMRALEAFVLTLILTVMGCMAAELAFFRPPFGEVAAGFIPRPGMLTDPAALALALGILGATVMPHNLYLHSSVMLSRPRPHDAAGRRETLRFATWDCALSLGAAFLVNASILILSATVFHRAAAEPVSDLSEAHRLLAGWLGAPVAATLFAVGLLASGVNSTLTGTMAGQAVTEGFLGLKTRPWVVRLSTRLAALVPALAIIGWLGEQSVGPMLVWSQIFLSLQLGFACWPLVRATSDSRYVGECANPPWLRLTAWTLTALILASNAWLLLDILAGRAPGF